VIFTTWTGRGFDIEALSPQSGERKRLIEDGTYARYSPTGHLVFVRGEDLFAVPFDSRSLEVTGPPGPLIENITVDPFTGTAFFSFSGDGLLVYAPGGQVSPVSEGIGQLLLIDRQGVASSLIAAERAFQLPRISPDGKRLLVTISEADKTDVWFSDLGRGTMERLTFEANNAAAIWTPDGARAAFSSDRSGAFNLYWKRADGSGSADRLTTNENTQKPQMPTSWSPDGSQLAFSEWDPSTGSWDIWLLPIEPRGEPRSLLRTSFNENGATFSPDGRWIAYVSDKTDQDEVYVTAYPDGKEWQISTGGGSEPVWAPHGRELFYRHEEWMMSVTVETGSGFTAGKPRPLFEAPYAEVGAAYPNFDITPDGRFVMIRSKLESAATRLIAVLNWFEELKLRAPTPSH
jgi:dipeptidyl aminopeptidase/acylaminoacyl peptidase